jgi:hypothetical protein
MNKKDLSTTVNSILNPPKGKTLKYKPTRFSD